MKPSNLTESKIATYAVNCHLLKLLLTHTEDPYFQLKHFINGTHPIYNNVKLKEVDFITAIPIDGVLNFSVSFKNIPDSELFSLSDSVATSWVQGFFDNRVDNIEISRWN